MSVLSDRTLLARLEAHSIVVEPLSENAIQPASIDVRLGERLLIWNGYDHGHGTVDLTLDQSSAWEPLALISDHQAPERESYFWLWPNKLYLGATLEHVEVPDDLLCQVHGRSSLARLGIVIHQQSGLVDPGWKGRLTLEITVAEPTILRPSMPIGQLTFQRLTTPCERPYGSDGLHSRYQGDCFPTPSKLFAGEIHASER